MLQQTENSEDLEQKFSTTFNKTAFLFLYSVIQTSYFASVHFPIHHSLYKHSWSESAGELTLHLVSHFVQHVIFCSVKIARCYKKRNKKSQPPPHPPSWLRCIWKHCTAASKSEYSGKMHTRFSSMEKLHPSILPWLEWAEEKIIQSTIKWIFTNQSLASICKLVFCKAASVYQVLGSWNSD